MLGVASIVAACASPPVASRASVGTVASQSAATRQLVSSSIAASSTPIAVSKTSLPDLDALAQTHREKTQQETERLAALAQLPPGAVATKSVAAALSGPTMGTPGTGSLIDTVHYFTVAMPLGAAVQWITSHRPAGLTQSGSSGGDESPNLSRGVGFAAPDDDAWTGAQLEIGVFPIDARTTAWRIDGLAEWLDPRPVPDTTGPTERMNLTVAGGCPTTDENKSDVKATGAGTRSLLPEQRPTKILICAYYDGNHHPPLSLAKRVLLAGDAAARVATAAGKISVQHQNGYLTTCPMTEPIAAYGIAVSYPDRPDAALWYSTQLGCPSISNGTITSGNPTREFLNSIGAD